MKSWKSLLAVVVVAIVPFALVACSGAPSHAAIKRAVKAMLQERVPAPWWSGGVHCQKAEIAVIEIEKIGSFNAEGKYWSVTVHVKGRCELQSYPSKQWRPFDGTGEVALSRGKDGTWTAAPIKTGAGK